MNQSKRKLLVNDGNRTRTLRVRLRPSEEQMFKRMASMNDMTVSDYVRRVLKHQIKIDMQNVGKTKTLTD